MATLKSESMKYTLLNLNFFKFEPLNYNWSKKIQIVKGDI